MTLGPAMLFLWAVDAGTPRWLRPALIVGKVPMFYYLLHIPLIHLIAVAVCYARYGQVHWMFESPTVGQFPITPPPGWGYSLPIVYLVWVIVVVTCIHCAAGLRVEAAPQRCVAELFLKSENPCTMSIPPVQSWDGKGRRCELGRACGGSDESVVHPNAAAVASPIPVIQNQIMAGRCWTSPK